MIPVLKDDNAVLGFLSDALTCTVTEERNGIFELSMTYPISGQHADLIEVDKIILAKPNDTDPDQMFRIYEVTKPISGIITINAEHISYELSHLPIKTLTVSNANPTTVISRILSNGASGKGFAVRTSTITTKKNFKCEAVSVRGALGGVEGSVLDVFGGEFEFDNKYIKLYQSRGSDTGVIISYGKNLTDVSLTISTEGSYTAIFPYAKKDDTLLTLTEKTIAVPDAVLSKEKVYFHDFSSDFDSEEAFTEANLRSKANAYLDAHDLASPDVNMTVSFQHLWQSPEYAGLASLERVKLCDIVTIRHEGLGISVKAKVIKTIYNTLSECYDKLELGTPKANFSDTLRQQQSQINAVEQNQQNNHSLITQEYMAAIDRATKAITGYDGGYIVLNPSENPQELLIMDNEDILEADNVWRFNLGGLGHSGNGYWGTYDLALTMDGEINASMITTGVLNAMVIRAGILESVDGSAYFDVEDGYFSTAYAYITGGYISIGGSDYRTVISDGSIEQYLSSSLYTGGIVPLGSGSNYYQSIYCSEQSSVKGVSICQRLANGSFDDIASFNKDKIDLCKNTNVEGYIVTNTLYADQYTAVKHWRTHAFGGSGTAAYTANAYLGIGVVSKSPTASLEVKNYGSSGDTLQARLDIYKSSGEAYINIRGSSSDGNSKVLELGEEMWWNGPMNAKSYSIISTEEIKENIKESGSVIDLFKASKIYSYNLKEDPPDDDIPDDDGDVVIDEKHRKYLKPHIEEPSVSKGDESENKREKHECTGFVIERETPKEVISEDGKHIDLYSMVSITWKAVQEILTRVEALEGNNERNNRK